MNRHFFQFCIVATGAVLCGSLAADELDDALAALKKKAHRRVYSAHAKMDTPALNVPTAPTEEEKALDRLLREKDAQQDNLAIQSRSAMPRPVTIPRAVAPDAAETQDSNWLTPAFLDKEAAVSMPDEDGTDWIFNEVERQKGLREEKLALQEENTRVEQLLKQKNQAAELNRLKQYSQTPGLTFGQEREDRSFSLRPSTEHPDPLAIIRPPSRQTAEPTVPLFSPEAVRAASQPAPRLPGLNPLKNTDETPSKTSAYQSSLSPYLSTGSEVKPLSPLESIKKSRSTDPFRDDSMPKVKTGIWH